MCKRIFKWALAATLLASPLTLTAAQAQQISDEMVLQQLQQITRQGAPGMGMQARPAKKYQANALEHRLAQGHKVRQGFARAVHGQSFLGKVLNIPYQIGSAIWSPVEWATNKVVTPLLFKGLTVPAYHGMNRLRRNYLVPDDEFAKMKPLEQQQINALSYYTAGTAAKLATMFASSYTDKIIHSFAHKFLGKIIETNGLPDFSQHPTRYKDEVARRLFAKFEPHLPEKFQNGRAYELYQSGKRVYCQAKLVYDLVDNVTAVISLSYQLTTHAQVHGQSPMLVQSRLKKGFMVLDIVRRCADSYLKVVKYYEMEYPNWLSKFVTIANAICPWQDFIAGGYETGKMAYKVHQMFERPRREMIAFLKEKYGMKREEARKFHMLLKKIGPKANVPLRVKKRCRRIIESMLEKHGVDFKTFYSDYKKYITPENRMIRFLESKYKIKREDGKKLIACWKGAKMDQAQEILKAYRLTQEKLDSDQEMQEMSMNLFMESMQRGGLV